MIKYGIVYDGKVACFSFCQQHSHIWQNMVQSKFLFDVVYSVKYGILWSSIALHSSIHCAAVMPFVTSGIALHGLGGGTWFGCESAHPVTLQVTQATPLEQQSGSPATYLLLEAIAKLHFVKILGTQGTQAMYQSCSGIISRCQIVSLQVKVTTAKNTVTREHQGLPKQGLSQQ